MGLPLHTVSRRELNRMTIHPLLAYHCPFLEDPRRRTETAPSSFPVERIEKISIALDWEVRWHCTDEPE